jgi:hypothetical protein
VIPSTKGDITNDEDTDADDWVTTIETTPGVLGREFPPFVKDE